MEKFVVLLIVGLWAFLSWYAYKKITTKIAIKNFDKIMEEIDKQDLKVQKKINDWYKTELKNEGLEDEEDD